MKVLMLGWELPPLYAGGIGMVCYEMLKELSNQNIPVTYIMPMGPKEGIENEYANVIIAQNCSLIKNKKSCSEIIEVPAFFSAYQSPDEYEKEREEYEFSLGKKTGDSKSQLYGKSLFLEVDLFAKRLYDISTQLDFDVVHAHDWMTFPAAIGIADRTKKPLIVHVHNTIYDRYLGNASQHERDIEYNGMKRANKVIAISQYVKDMIIKHYDIDPNKIEIVHNAKNTYMNSQQNQKESYTIDLKNKKVVLFTGRITIQKGPEYFLYAAKKVLEVEPNTVFIMAGSGDMLNRMINLSAQLGINKNMIFTGRYNMSQAKALYSAADCFVMPSVSEPFGIVPLEAMAQNAPTIISKQSGCAEVLKNALKVDFWDINEMSNKIISVLRYTSLNNQLRQFGKIEVENLTWDKSVKKMIEIYDGLAQKIYF